MTTEVTPYAALLPRPGFWAKWNLRTLSGLACYGAVWLVLMLELPSRLWDPVTRDLLIVVGGLSLWRYGWWTNHLLRAWIYGFVRYPKLSRRAAAAWQAGWRPGHVHFVMVTFRERPEITRAVVDSIVRELRATRLSGTIWLGVGDESDVIVVADFLANHADGVDLRLHVAHQTRPGKRYALGAALRALARSDVARDDVVVLMDGDSIIGDGLLARCTALFAADPALGAMTTDEEPICFGPRWVQLWLAMRFAQRRIAMQSHALSGKVLTLTGRLSMFRIEYVIRPGFYELVEEDHLEHWLWGRFRFLSGDDKTTWYYMLRAGAKMI